MLINPTKYAVDEKQETLKTYSFKLFSSREDIGINHIKIFRGEEREERTNKDKVEDQKDEKMEESI
uniref:Uncharacterized protein n=1 Tax=Romanomermis culicivorax TaxID=13658 RepID=A0A915KVQ6_ROMCU